MLPRASNSRSHATASAAAFVGASAAAVVVACSAVGVASCTMGFDRFEGGGASDVPIVSDDGGAGAGDGRGGRDDGGRAGDAFSDGASDALDDAGDAAATCDAPGLVARWTFDEGSGADVHDCSSAKLHGVVMGAPKWAPGKKGGALELDGSYVSLGNVAKLKLTGALTVTAWILVTAYPPTVSTYVIGKTGNMAKGGWRLAVEPQRLSFSVARGGDQDGCEITAPSTATSTWIHVAGVYTPGASVALYVDGALVGTTTASPPPAVLDMPQELRVGVRGDTGGETYFRGRVDDVRIYDRALGPADISAIALE